MKGRGPPRSCPFSLSYKVRWGAAAPHSLCFIASVNTSNMYRLLCFLFVAHLVTARYYEPQPLNCESSKVIQYQDQTIQVSGNV